VPSQAPETGDHRPVDHGVCPTCLLVSHATARCPRCGDRLVPTAHPMRHRTAPATTTGTLPGLPSPPAAIDLVLGPAFRRLGPQPASTGSATGPAPATSAHRHSATFGEAAIDDRSELAEFAAVAAEQAAGRPARPVHPPRVGRTPRPGSPAKELPAWWAAAAATTVGVAACFGIGALLSTGSTPPAHGAGPAGPRAAVAATGMDLTPVPPAPTASASGQGSGSTVPFHPSGWWTLSYQIDCPGEAFDAASLSVVSRTSTLAGIDVSVVGTTSGTRSGLPPTTVTVQVDVPASCSWTVNASAPRP